ncbi:MAG: EamA family transporter RarD [Deltaproteobacteria bacterium]|nr:EamA family transporter RarD [Deltaproteobacteria bacterium]
MADSKTTTAGVLYALAAYGTWGFAPLFWKLLTTIPSGELLAYRIVAAMVVFLLLLVWRGRFRELQRGYRDLRTLRFFVLAALLIGFNWYLYVYAVATGNILQGSLGYFMNPLFNVVLGMVFLGERLRPWQWVAVALAAAGVMQLAIRSETFPWIAIALMVSFGFYGLVRKVSPVDALVGSNLETSLLVPLAAGFLVWLGFRGEAYFLQASPGRLLLLVATGLMTALPLLWFSNAARRLPLTTLGFFQYLAPTLQFLIAVGVYGEPFSSLQLRCFGCIWVALVIFSLEARRHRRRRSPVPAY